MTHVFTLYLYSYPVDKSYHWCEVLNEMWALSREFSSPARGRSDPELHGIFLEMWKTGIWFDTIEYERPAVFLADEVEIEPLDDSGSPATRWTETWGNGGKTGKQVKAKLLSMLATFGKLLANGDITPEPSRDPIAAKDVDELIAHIRSDELEENSDFAVEDDDEDDEGLPPAVKWKEETLLPMNIWIDEAQTYLCYGHAKRVEFQLDASDDLKPEPVGWMDLDGNVHLDDPDACRLREDELNQLRNFVHNNRRALEQLADARLRMNDVWDAIIKGGDPAAEEQISALNEKVAALVAARAPKA